MKQTTSARSAAVLLACGTVLAFAGATANAQDKPVQLKLSTWAPLQHPVSPALQAWADDVKKASGGTIGSTMFSSEQLGKAFDHYDMARDGIADFAYVSPGYQPGRFPIIAAASLPFMIGNAKGGSAAVDAWYRQYAATEMKDVKFCFAFVHDPGTFHSRKKIVLPSDIKGLKVRPGSATIGQMVTLLGGTNVQGSASEARDMLDRGVADAMTFPWGSIPLYGIDKVVRYHLDVALYTVPLIWVMNKAKYESLAPAQKKVIDDHCTSEWAEKIATPWADFERGGVAKIAAEPGHEIDKLTPEQLAAWRAAVAPTQAAWAASVQKAGQGPKAVLDALERSLAKYKAGL